ncbi:MAG: COR domain-containing protein [Candidatus Hodarchaeota archaeon]
MPQPDHKIFEDFAKKITARSIEASFDPYGNMISLSIKGLQDETLPSEIGHFTTLTNLDLSNNGIKELPSEISRLVNLDRRAIFGWKNDGLDIRGNPLEKPPPEIAAKGIHAIADYFKQIQISGVDYLYEAKLLIVGEAGAGKTTLAKKISNPGYKLQKNEKSTEGIDVARWKFTLANGSSFAVNVWDFGGQEIYHSTHQFFLTKRSLYVLLADTRKEDTDFFYWLNVIELLSENSPVLIIKNEKQDRQREINERQLRGRFKNLEKILATNLATNRGLPEVLAQVKHYISNLPHIGTSLPKTWIDVRETLENDVRNYISLDEYFKICQKHGFIEREDMLQLSGYLHDLGVCLHFQEDPLLNRLLILKPEWGTDAVYKLLDNKTVINSKGLFNRSHLKTIWCEEKYANMHAELLRLMINFKLCYEIPNTQDYIAPQLLTENQPHYEWPQTKNLTLRYSYDFMPKGIISQFIVTINHLIANQKYVWRSGVILKKDKTAAEVIEDYNKRELRIRISGKHKKELLTIITYELDQIHSTYQLLKVTKLIPCNCNTCKPLNEPHYYSFETLREFIVNGQREIQCQKKPYKMIDVLGLIDDVIGKEKFIEQEKKGGRGIFFGSAVERVIIQQSKHGNNIVEENMKQEKVINVGGKANISAPIVIADSIENSFNTLSESAVDDELKQLLDQLLREINNVYKKTPLTKADDAEAMARDAETLIKEVSSSKPRRQWYEVSLEGLKQAAINIGEVAVPVLTIVKKLTQLLLA